MSQSRVRGRGRGFRSTIRNDSQNVRSNDGNKSTKNISHSKICCQEIINNFELDEQGANFFQDLKALWNMCK